RLNSHIGGVRRSECVRETIEPAGARLVLSGSHVSSPTDRCLKWPCPYIACPTALPMTAVAAMGNAPQKVTRTVGLNTSAPPSVAPMPPKIARHKREPPEISQDTLSAGEITARATGTAAPTEKVAAEVSAACTGFATT